MKKTEENGMNRMDKLKEITEQLEKAVQEFMDSDKYKIFLFKMAQFHTYSLNNVLLIARQKPDATLCASYNGWKKQNRYVKKGEKGIKIICPAPYKAATLKNVINQETGKEMLTADGKPMKEVVEVIVPAYKVGYTFDISQTEGEPLPEIIHNLEGELSNHQKELKEALLKGSPVPVFFRQIAENGYYNLTEKYIVVNKDLSERQMLKTLIHEIGHALLHNIDAPEAQVDLATKEVQAESIAYVVCQYFGMDTSEYSFGYISDWSTRKDVKELKNSLEVIRSTSNDIISKTEKLLVEIQCPKQELAEAIQDIHKKGRSM